MSILGRKLDLGDIEATNWSQHIDGLEDWATKSAEHSNNLHSISQRLDASGDSIQAAIIRLLAATVSLRLSARTPNSPFRPLIRVGNNVSTMVEDYDAADVECLRWLSEAVADPWLAARLADVACVAGQAIGQNLWRSAQFAANAYLRHCEHALVSDEAIESREEIQRGLDLASMYAKRNERLHRGYWEVVEAAIRSSLNRGWPGMYLSLSEMVIGRNRELGLRLAPLFEEHGTRLSVGGVGYQPDNAQLCFELAARFWQRNRDDSEARRLQRAAAEVLVERSRLPSQAMLKADWLSAGIAKLRQYGGDRTRIQALKDELSDVRRSILEEMQQHEFAIDVADLIAHVRATVVGPTKHEAILQLAYGIGHGARYQNVRQSVLDGNARYPVADLFARVTYDDHGVPVSRAEAFDRNNEEHIFVKMVEQVREIDAPIAMRGILEAIDCLDEDLRPSLSDLMLYAHQSPAVPEGHEESTARALMAGFNHDWVEVAAFLVPQSEAVVRRIFKLERQNTLVARGDGIEEEMSLNQLLESAQADQVLGRDFVLQWRALFTERSGFNLRNLYSHGLLTDDAVHSAGLYNAWWVFLRVILFIPWGQEWFQGLLADGRRSADSSVQSGRRGEAQ